MEVFKLSGQWVLAFVLSFLLCKPASSQTMQSSGYNGQNAGAAIMSDEFRMNLPGNQNQGIQFFKHNYIAPTIDLRSIKQVTGFDIPDNVLITPPAELDDFEHKTVLIGLAGSDSDPHLIIWLAINYEKSENVILYLDRNQDRNFRNDVGPIHLSAGNPKAINITSNGEPISMEFSVPRPENSSQKASASVRSNEIKFYRQRYMTPTIDLRMIKEETGYDIPESISIVPPRLSSFESVMVMVGLQKDSLNTKMKIWLVSNYDLPGTKLYMDYDQNRDFTDDVGPLSVRTLSLPRATPINRYSARQEVTNETQIESKTQKPKERIENVLTLEFNAGAGSGSLAYSDGGIGYNVNISEKMIGAELIYHSRVFFYGISTSLQNHYFYASYGGFGGGVNLDIHPNNKFQFGLVTGVRAKLSNFIDFVPLIRTGYTQYLKSEYISNRYSDESYKLELSSFLEYGFRMEFTVGANKALAVEFANNRQQWEPEGLPNSSRFKSKMRINKYRIGYKFGL